MNKFENKNSNSLINLKEDHLLIWDVVSYINKYLYETEECDRLDIDLISSIIEFFNTFVVSLHFAKEEEILFSELKKMIAIENNLGQLLTELELEHTDIKALIIQLIIIKKSYDVGNNSVTNEMIELLKEITKKYVEHIKKEDEQLITQLSNYLSPSRLVTLDYELLLFNQTTTRHIFRDLIAERYRNNY
ncbi:MAG: hemerythrin domain-containing protein [Candidatus Margulisbacteria bacterium]|nr:hemerythrin domain-containing protein [Candidatus Margulisiibacteriota bacterium]